MNIVDPGYFIITPIDSDYMLNVIEDAARNCYRSEGKKTDTSKFDLLKRLLKTGHVTPFEHISISVKIFCDRGVSHEAVRHRVASFSQSSTRYCNYAKDQFGSEISVVRPFFWKPNSILYALWLTTIKFIEWQYMSMIRKGAKAQEARSILPNSLLTEVVTTCNLREWMHIFNLRCSGAAHPQIAQIMLPLLEDFHNQIPVVFDDLYDKYKTRIEEFKIKAPIKMYTNEE